MPSCFVAYPSQPPSLAETICKAIEEIKKGQTVAIDGWQSTTVTGKFIISAICDVIAERDIFVCDLTNLNHNVLFELGFAIARKKRIWVLLNPNIEKSIEDHKKFKLLTTVGHATYSNSNDIVKNFYEEQPWDDLQNTIYKSAIESVINIRNKDTLLYLKSGIQTDASIKLSRLIHNSQIPNIVDDPKEINIQTLSWYAQKVYSAYAVVVHFLAHDHVGWRLHNAKNSLVAGLAHGFGKPLLMLAHEPYSSPIDYQDLLKTHKTAAQCETIASDWLSGIEQTYIRRTADVREYMEEVKLYSTLQTISIGDPIAENEAEDLLDYFVPTATYNEALTANHSIIIGRKGSGKTAIFYSLAEEIQSDPRNHVCIIQPVAYQLEGIFRVLQQTLHLSEKGYMLDCFWKFIIYTELAKSVFDTLAPKPYYQLDDNEKELLEFVAKRASIITPDFAIRLESVVVELQAVNSIGASTKDQRVELDKLLHGETIAELRLILGKVLQNKHKVVILLDNLDKAWKVQTDLSTLSLLLLALLGVSRRIVRDFQKSDSRKLAVNLSLILFLRSDIFSQIIQHAREKDKISYSKIIWDDPEVLIGLLEQRFLISSPELAKPKEIWTQYFCDSIKGQPTKEYLTNYILPRPRDLIYLSKAALELAVNRHHTKIQEKDILEAQKKYSQNALDSLIAEISTQTNNPEEFLYEFVAENEIITRQEILEKIKKVNAIDEDKQDEVIDLLCDLAFIGRETRKDQFDFLYHDEDKRKFQVMARKTAEIREDKIERFRINEAYHAYLEITPV